MHAKASTTQQTINSTSAKIVGVVGLETTIIAGEKQALLQIESLLTRRGIRFQWLPNVRVQSLIPFLSESGILLFVCLIGRNILFFKCYIF